MVKQGTARQARRGSVGHGAPKRRSARHGRVWRGRPGLAWCGEAVRVAAWTGVVRPGLAASGTAGRGTAGTASTGKARFGTAWKGRRGKGWHGRHG